MKKNYEEKAIGLLRTNTAIPSTIAKEIEGIFIDSFAVNANDCFFNKYRFQQDGKLFSRQNLYSS